MRDLRLPGRQVLRRAHSKRNLFVLVCLFSVVFAVWFVPLSSAHNSLVTVSLDCKGNASYTATAWAAPSAASRTNTDVRVSESTDHGATWVQVGQGQFNQADHFAFSGTFSIGSSKSVQVKVQEFANWGDGVKPGPPGSASATAPSNCSPTTTTSTTTTSTTSTSTTTTTPSTTTPPAATPPATTTATTTTTPTPPPAATATAPLATTTTTATTTRPASRPAAGILGASATKHVAKVKKVTARAKPAHATVAGSSFTG